MPWHIPSDLKRFKQITTQTRSPDKMNMVIMGRKTWESLPERVSPLPGRLNCVITRKTELIFPEKVISASSLDEALMAARQSRNQSVENIFVIGGAQVYNLAINHRYCQKILWTHVHGDFDCDTRIDVDITNFSKLSESPTFNENNIRFHYIEYQRLSDIP